MAEVSVAADMLQSFVRRIESLDDEILALNADKSEVYKELKGQGFDVKVLRKLIADRRKDASERAEFETIYELYAEALGMRLYRHDGDKPSLVRAHVENIEQFPVEHDADGVFLDDEPRDLAPQDSAQMRIGDLQHVQAAELITSPAGAEGIVDRHPIQPETANEVPDQPTEGGPHESAAHPVPVNLDGRQQFAAPTVGQNDSEHQRVGDYETNTAPAGRAADESPATNITALRQSKPMRPNCLKPDMCGGQGRDHCWTCTKAAQQLGAA